MRAGAGKAVVGQPERTTQTSEGAWQAGGYGTPKHPHGSLEKAFPPSGVSPPPNRALSRTPPGDTPRRAPPNTRQRGPTWWGAGGSAVTRPKKRSRTLLSGRRRGGERRPKTLPAGPPPPHRGLLAAEAPPGEGGGTRGAQSMRRAPPEAARHRAPPLPNPRGPRSRPPGPADPAGASAAGRRDQASTRTWGDDGEGCGPPRIGSRAVFFGLFLPTRPPRQNVPRSDPGRVNRERDDTTASASDRCKATWSAPGAPEGRARRTERVGEPAPPQRRGEPHARLGREGRAESVRCVRRPRGPASAAKRGGDTRSGRIPHPCLPHTTAGVSAGRRGARGQSEKSDPIRHECPSLVWRGLGPARESATSPHRSGKKNGRGRRTVPLSSRGEGWCGQNSDRKGKEPASAAGPGLSPSSLLTTTLGSPFIVSGNRAEPNTTRRGNPRGRAAAWPQNMPPRRPSGVP